MEQILGFAPDAPWGTLNTLQDCSAMVPYTNGLEQAGSWIYQGWDAVPSAVLGSFYGSNTSGVARYFAGTSTKLYRSSGATWSDITRSVGGNYVAGTQWMFAQFGDQTLATNGGAYTADPVQIATTTSGNFADISTAIGASVIVSATSSGGGFVLLFNTNDASYGTNGDRWWCSAVNDATSWTPSVSTQCTTGRLIGSPGSIVTAAQLSGDTVVAFKKDSLYVGRYVGPPSVWQWTEVVGQGCRGRFASCSIDGGVFFVNDNGLFVYDGSSLLNVGKGKIGDWWKRGVIAGTINPQYVFCTFERKTNHVRVWYPTTGSNPNSCLVYSIETGTFGKDSIQTITSVMPVNQEANPHIYTFYSSDNKNYGLMLNSTRTACSMTSGYVGSDETVSSINKFVLRHDKRQKTLSNTGLQPYSYKESGGTSTSLTYVESTSDSPMSSTEIFKLRASGRWFNGTFSFPAGDATDYVKCCGIEAQLVQRGKR